MNRDNADEVFNYRNNNIDGLLDMQCIMYNMRFFIAMPVLVAQIK